VRCLRCCLACSMSDSNILTNRVTQDRVPTVLTSFSSSQRRYRGACVARNLWITWIHSRWNICLTIWLGHLTRIWIGHHELPAIRSRNLAHAAAEPLNCFVNSSTHCTIVGFSLACMNVSMKKDVDNSADISVMSGCTESNVCGM